MQWWPSVGRRTWTGAHTLLHSDFRLVSLSLDNPFWLHQFIAPPTSADRIKQSANGAYVQYKARGTPVIKILCSGALRNNNSSGSSSSSSSSDMTMTAPACRADDVDYTLAHYNRLREQQQQQQNSRSSKQPDKQVGRVISS